MIFWLLVLMLLYVAISVACIWGLQFVLFPLGTKHAGQTYVMGPTPAQKVVVYLQGNAEEPDERHPVIKWFVSQGFTVLSVGYSRSFEDIEQRIMTLVQSHLVHQRIPWGVYAHSIGTCIAPALCQRLKAIGYEPRFVIYATPVTSVARLVSWHSRSILSPIATYVYGAERGLQQHNVEPTPDIILAQNDTITPPDDVKELLPSMRVDASHIHMMHGGHNDYFYDNHFLNTLESIVQ